jgi:hypothetical protein
VEGGGVHGRQTLHRPENHRPGIVVGVFELGQSTTGLSVCVCGTDLTRLL